LIEALFDDVRRPLIDFVVSVGVAADGALDSLLDDVADLVDDESGLLGSVEIIHDCSLKISTTTVMAASDNSSRVRDRYPFSQIQTIDD